jgi:hypothetical protein
MYGCKVLNLVTIVDLPFINSLARISLSLLPRDSHLASDENIDPILALIFFLFPLYLRLSSSINVSITRVDS